MARDEIPTGHVGWQGWEPGAFYVRGGLDGVVERYVVAGWTKGALALDFRPLRPSAYARLGHHRVSFAWALTHLPTGYGMCAFATDALAAQCWADEMAKLADWPEVTVETAAGLSDAIDAFFGQHSDIILRSVSHVIAPWAAAA